MFYAARGSIPHQRHTQHRAPDGTLYAEELFGVEGFTGRSSLLYHLTPPTRTHQIEPVSADPARGRRRRPPPPSADQDRRRRAAAATSSPAACRCSSTATSCSASSARRESMPDGTFYRNGDRRRDAVRPRGHRRLRHDLRAAPLRPGRLPRPADRHDLAAGPGRRAPSSGCSTSRRRRRSSRRSATATTTASCSSTRRTRSATSMRPDEAAPRDRRGRLRHPRPLVATGSRPTTTATTRSTSSAGMATSGRSASTSATSSRSPAASTSRRRSTRRSRRATSSCARSCRASSTTTRSRSRRRTTTRTSTRDEVIYYVAGNFMSRRGVEIASFTLHPAGIPHGPHPGTVEASIGKEATEELAVMVDTFHPLHVTQAAMDLDDDRYPVLVAAARGRVRRGAPSSASAARRRSPTDGATWSRLPTDSGWGAGASSGRRSMVAAKASNSSRPFVTRSLPRYSVNM